MLRLASLRRKGDCVCNNKEILLAFRCEPAAKFKDYEMAVHFLDPFLMCSSLNLSEPVTDEHFTMKERCATLHALTSVAPR